VYIFNHTIYFVFITNTKIAFDAC